MIAADLRPPFVYDQWRAPRAENYPTPNACKFVSGDDFLRIAMQSYLAAGRDVVPPAGECWAEDGSTTWADAECFFAGLLRHLGTRLRQAAIARGDLAEVPWSEEAEREHEPLLALLAGAGRSPAVEGHGCPAGAPGEDLPVSAVGPAPSDLAGVQVTIPAEPAFSGPEGQSLPTAATVGDTQAAQEAA